MTREHAWDLLNEYTKNPNLIKHALAVEAAMRWYARKFGEDAEKWGIVGLLHDFDYERWPTAGDHPNKGAEILEEHAYPDDVIYAIKAHAPYMNLPRQRLLDKALFAVDELCGFITAVTLVRPGKSLNEVSAEAVRKKMKDKRFAASVSREDMLNGAKELGMELDSHIENVIEGMKEVREQLGL